MQVVVNTDNNSVVWVTGHQYIVNNEPFWPTPSMAIKDAKASAGVNQDVKLVTWEIKDKKESEKIYHLFHTYGASSLAVEYKDGVINRISKNDGFIPPSHGPSEREQIILKLDAILADLALLKSNGNK